MITRDDIASSMSKAFPDFAQDGNDRDLPFIVLGNFARFLLHLQESREEQQLDKAVKLIEQLYVEGDRYVREAATIGLLEGIQNLWGHAGTDPEIFGRRLLPESRRWWDSLNKFWQNEIPYVGADLKGITELDDAGNSHPAGQ